MRYEPGMQAPFDGCRVESCLDEWVRVLGSLAGKVNFQPFELPSGALGRKLLALCASDSKGEATCRHALAAANAVRLAEVEIREMGKLLSEMRGQVELPPGVVALRLEMLHV